MPQILDKLAKGFDWAFGATPQERAQFEELKRTHRVDEGLRGQESKRLDADTASREADRLYRQGRDRQGDISSGAVEPVSQAPPPPSGSTPLLNVADQIAERKALMQKFLVGDNSSPTGTQLTAPPPEPPPGPTGQPEPKPQGQAQGVPQALPQTPPQAPPPPSPASPPPLWDQNTPPMLAREQQGPQTSQGTPPAPPTQVAAPPPPPPPATPPPPSYSQFFSPDGKLRILSPREQAARADEAAAAHLDRTTELADVPHELQPFYGATVRRPKNQVIDTKVMIQDLKDLAPKIDKLTDPQKQDEVAARANVLDHPNDYPGVDLSKPLINPSDPTKSQITPAQVLAARARQTKNVAEGKQTDLGMEHVAASIASLAASTANANARAGEINLRNNPKVIGQELKDYNAGKIPYPSDRQTRAEWALYHADNPTTPMPVPRSPAAQKVLATTEPVLSQMQRIMKSLEPLKDNNTPGYFAGESAMYKIGIAPADAELLANMNMSSITGAARVLAGSSRAIAALKLAMEHTPTGGWHKSPKLLYEQAHNISTALMEVKQSALDHGNKFGVDAEGAGTEVHPAATHRWNPATGKVEEVKK
jgi:hypothetical protein